MGHAEDYVEGMYLILQQDKPEDFVLATGTTTTVRDFVKLAFAELGILIQFEGENEAEIARVVDCIGDIKLDLGSVVVEVDKNYYRPTEVDLLIGDASKAHKKLKWYPKYDLSSLVKEMVQTDFNRENLKLKSN